MDASLFLLDSCATCVTTGIPSPLLLRGLRSGGGGCGVAVPEPWFRAVCMASSSHGLLSSVMDIDALPGRGCLELVAAEGVPPFCLQVPVKVKVIVKVIVKVKVIVNVIVKVKVKVPYPCCCLVLESDELAC